MAGKPEKTFQFGYHDLAKISGLGDAALYKHVSRKELDPNDLESIILWAAKHGTESLKLQMVSNLVRLDLKQSHTKRGQALSASKKAKKSAKKPVKKPGE